MRRARRRAGGATGGREDGALRCRRGLGLGDDGDDATQFSATPRRARSHRAVERCGARTRNLAEGRSAATERDRDFRGSVDDSIPQRSLAHCNAAGRREDSGARRVRDRSPLRCATLDRPGRRSPSRRAGGGGARGDSCSPSTFPWPPSSTAPSPRAPFLLLAPVLLVVNVGTVILVCPVGIRDPRLV